MPSDRKTTALSCIPEKNQTFPTYSNHLIYKTLSMPQ